VSINTEASEAMVDLYCKELKLPGLRKSFREVAREALAQGKSHTEFLAACLAQEVLSRRESRLRSRMNQAKFPAVKTLESFDFTAIPDLSKPEVLALAQGDFIRRKENVVCLGNSGTGKTHIAIALGVAAIAAGYRVRFVQVVNLVQELLQANAEYRLPKYLKGWQKVDLVICDELGYIGLGPGGPLLFQFLAERYERGSVIVTSNLEFSRWGEVFGDATLTAALLDRLTHHAHILLFNGQSYRFKESRERQVAATGGTAEKGVVNN
jgi:DNA replication protein DnaC